MFVRNNTKCPYCGKYAAFDVYALASPFSDPDSFIFRVECSECLGFSEREVDATAVKGWLLILAHAMDMRAQMRYPRRWSTHIGKTLSLTEREAVARAVLLYFPRGEVLSELVGSPALCAISRKLLTPGDRIRRFHEVFLPFSPVATLSK